MVLKSISFCLEEGNFLAILGNNGTGKSTMMKCLNKIIKPDSGSVVLDKEEILHLPPREIAKRIAFVSQAAPDARLTVKDMVLLGRKPYMGWGFTKEDYRIAEETIDALQLWPMEGRYFHELSGGEKQKVMLARALTQQPKVLLLDEPTSSLDIKNQYQVLETVKKICKNRGIMAIVVIHDLNLALRFCNRFLLMEKGKLYRYGDQNVLDRQALWDIYGVRGEIVEVKKQKIVCIDGNSESSKAG